MPRRETDSPNWGGPGRNGGRPRKYVKVPIKFYAERSEPTLLTPESDLSICLAETEVDENDTRRGIVIGDIWYGAAEALAIAEFVKKHRRWLQSVIHAPQH